jgi:hypothetical protein
MGSAWGGEVVAVFGKCGLEHLGAMGVGRHGRKLEWVCFQRVTRGNDQGGFDVRVIALWLSELVKVPKKEISGKTGNGWKWMRASGVKLVK